MQNFNFDIFGKKVALEAVKRKADVVIMYDTNSLECFNKLKNTNIIRIMDTSIANREYTKHIYESVKRIGIILVKKKFCSIRKR